MATDVSTDKAAEYQRLDEENRKFYKRRIVYEKRFVAKREFLANIGTLGEGGAYLQHIHEEMIMDLFDRIEALEGLLALSSDEA